MPYIIKTEKLSHIYGKSTPFEKIALKDVDFRVRRGSFTGIIGRTGSGKSTLIQHLNGLLRPSSGTVLFDGEDIWSRSYAIRDLRFRVGLVFQYPEYQLFEETVARDIAFGPVNMGLSEDETGRRVLEAAEFAGLSGADLEKSPFELSGGQKRRAAIAGVIAMRPDVLILDEPTAGLDPRGREDILSRIREYHEQRGSTVILVTHSMEEIARFVDSITVMDGAGIAMTSKPSEIFTRTRELSEMGLAAPSVTRIFVRLRELGLPVRPDVLTVAQGVNELMRLKNRAGGVR